MTKDEWYKQLFERLGNSKFRSGFHLKQKDIDYINDKGLDTIRQHARDFIAKREAPAVIPNDGKQTPTKGARCPVDIGFARTEAGADAVDYKLISICHKDDVVVSQDYGVAAMALGKGLTRSSGPWL